MNIVRMHVCDHWIDAHAQGVKGELYQSYSLHFLQLTDARADRYVDELVNSHSKHPQ